MLSARWRCEGLLVLLVALCTSTFAFATPSTPSTGSLVKRPGATLTPQTAAGCAATAGREQSSPSSRTHYALAQCLESAGKLTRAKVVYERALNSPEVTTELRALAAAGHNRVTESQARLHLRTNGKLPKQTKITCGDRLIQLEREQVVALDPGRHEIRIAAAGFQTNIHVIELKKAERATLVMQLKKLAPAARTPQAPRRSTPLLAAPRLSEQADAPAATLAYSVLGAGTLTAGVGAYLGYHSRRLLEKSSELCSPTVKGCAQGTYSRELEARASREKWLARVAVPAGLVGVVTGVYLLFKHRREQEAHVGVRPWVSYRNVGAMVSGSW